MNLTEQMKKLVQDGIGTREWTLAEFERRTGLAHGTAERVYKGVTNSINDDNATKVCSALQLSLDDFWKMSMFLVGAGGLVKEAPAKYITDRDVLDLSKKINALSPKAKSHIVGLVDLLGNTNKGS